jgi:hypothetical protein
LDQAEPKFMSHQGAHVWAASGWRWGRVAGACVLVLGLLAGCSGGGGAGGGAGGGSGFDNTDTGVDDRTLGGGPDGTGTVPHVEIFHELPGGDPSRDVAGSGADLGG